MASSVNLGTSLVSFPDTCRQKAKLSWDRNLKETKGKKYMANSLAKLAEILSNLPVYYEQDSSRGSRSEIWKAFTAKMNTEKPPSQGFVFDDGYRDVNMELAEPDPQNNCYFRVPFKYEEANVTLADCPVIRGRQYSLSDVRKVVHDYIDSFFYKNDGYFVTSCASTYCAFFGIHVPVMMVAIGEGGDGKGAFDILESSLFGKQNSATLDPAIFVDDNEWRKSAHFGLHKKRVCIKESKTLSANVRINVDVLKRFIAGEEMIVRANFGFSSEVRFNKMKKQQSCNYDDVSPIMSLPRSVAAQDLEVRGEEAAPRKSPTESVDRRYVTSAVGLATLVIDSKDVDHENGRFLKIASDILENILACPAGAHVYFREILQPTWDALGDTSAIVSTLEPENLDDHMKVSTRWYIQRLTNQQCDPRPKCVMNISPGAAGGGAGGSDSEWDMLTCCLRKLWQEENKKKHGEERKLAKGRGRLVGDWKVARELCNLLDVPRASAFTKIVALTKSCGPLAEYLIQKDTDVNFFGKQQLYALIFPVDVDKMLKLSKSFDIPAPAARPSERWLMGARPGDKDYMLSDEEQEFRQADCSVVCAVADVVDIDALVAHVDSGVDRRQVQVQGYSRLLDKRGTASMEVAVDGGQRSLRSLLRTYMKYGFGRIHTAGPSLQKVTREARRAALAGIPGGVLELDMKVAFFSLLVVALKQHDQLNVEAEFPLLCDVVSNWDGWKSFVSEYFDVEVAVAKKLLISATSPYGRQSPNSQERPDWLPHLDCLQTEIGNASRFLLEHDALYQEVAKARPDCSSLHIFLGELECSVLMDMKQLLEEAGAAPISLVYDGIYFRPMGLDVHDENFIARVSAIEAGHGISLHLKDLSGAPIPWRIAAPQPGGRVPDRTSVSQPHEDDFSSVLAAACEKLEGRALKVVPGENMCVISALTNMDLVAGEPSQAGFASGPYSYRQLQKLYPPLKFSEALMSDLICADIMHHFLLHIGTPGTRGHAIGLRAREGSPMMLVYDSRQEVVMQIGDEALYDLVTHWDDGRRRVRLLRVADGDDGEGSIEADVVDLVAGSTRPCTKRPAAFQSCMPKRGKARMVRKIAKRPAAKHKTPYVPYVRHGQKTIKSRPERIAIQCSLKTVYTASAMGLVKKLTASGHLRDWCGEICPFCGKGQLGPLKSFPNRSPSYRCGRKRCHKFVLPHHHHPVFSACHGNASAPFADKVSVFMCATWDVAQSKCHQITGNSHKLIENVYTRLDRARMKYVIKKEKRIKFGAIDKWPDVEADEVDLGKIDDAEMDDRDKPVQWEQWGGLVERGRPNTLVLTRLDPCRTKRRAPGPGPIRKRDWKPIAKRHLENREVVLHTDGAKAYKLKIPKVLHDNVVHMKKKVTVRGVTRWIKPKYSEVVAHRLPTGEQLYTKSGTQIIDRFWAHLRKHLQSRTRRVSTLAATRRIRSAQWTYWNKGADLWACTGAMLKDLY